MSDILVIDPGVRCTGAAVFDSATKRLLSARRFTGRGFNDDLEGIADMSRDIAQWTARRGELDMVVEWPQVYAARARGRKDPNDLLPLAALIAMVHIWMTPRATTLVRPHDWKGSKKANPTARWIISRLDAHERAQIEDFEEFEAALAKAEAAGKDVAHLAHNTVDAVGVGLHHLGRLGRGRVIHR